LTDGITEARAPKAASSKSNHFLGEEGLMRLAREAQGKTTTVREMGRFILDGARTFGGGVLRDDACILIARRR
jgi:serine phosphatase RsbU (regulator of sigma subunit)